MRVSTLICLVTVALVGLVFTGACVAIPTPIPTADPTFPQTFSPTPEQDISTPTHPPSPTPTLTSTCTPTLLPTYTDTPEPTPTLLPDNIERITFLQYNILYGGGIAEFVNNMAGTSQAIERARLCLDIIAAADADILIINKFFTDENAVSWFAHEFGYPNYFIAKNMMFDGSDQKGRIAIFTKAGYEIDDVKSLHYPGPPYKYISKYKWSDLQIAEASLFRGLKAKVVTPKGNELNCFRCSFNPNVHFKLGSLVGLHL